MSQVKYSKATAITAVKGMNDVLPCDSYKWLWLEEKLKKWLFSYGYSNIRTPIVEDTRLFVRSIGEVTDIVEKEMYTFTDKLNNDSLTLRPEGTAGTIRAVIEHNLLYNTTQKLWYIGQMFRHERPQKGRYRQFHQLGVEALGFAEPNIDTEIILMLHDLWRQLGLQHVQLQINCLGNSVERATHREALIKYFEQHEHLLDNDAKRRLYTNPLRILDTKNPDMQKIVEQAPRLSEFLGDVSRTHHEKWKAQLITLGIPFIENHRLVRGLDYYNLSVFEWIDCGGNLGAQSTIAAGGRYDQLIADLGGGANYAIGFGIGIERLLLTLDNSGLIPIATSPDVYIVNINNNGKDSDDNNDSKTININEYCFKVAVLLRENGFNVVQNLGKTSSKTQFKKADSVGAKVAIVIGENEVLSNQVVLKSMYNGLQQLIDYNNIIVAINRALNIE